MEDEKKLDTISKFVERFDRIDRQLESLKNEHLRSIKIIYSLQRDIKILQVDFIDSGIRAIEDTPTPQDEKE